MNLEDHVTSLELSQKLRELEVKQESCFYYHWYKKNRDYEYIDCQISNENLEEFDDGKWQLKVYSAFLASELGLMMPNSNEYAIDFVKDRDMWITSFVEIEEIYREYRAHFRAKNEADSRALMLIYLMEKGLLKHE